MPPSRWRFNRRSHSRQQPKEVDASQASPNQIRRLATFSARSHRAVPARPQTHSLVNFKTTVQLTNNTILITGGGCGIGRGLAEAFHALGNHVIISGRSQKTLEETTVANPGMKSLTVDMTDPASIRTLAARLTEEHPSLNVLINNAVPAPP